MNDQNLITRSTKTSLFVGAILFIFLSQRVSLRVLWGGTFGMLLSALNLYILSAIAKTLLGSGHKKRGLLYAALKFPIFYSLLIFLLFQFNFSAIAFMIGFSVPLFVIILKTYGGFVVERADFTRSA